MEELAGVGPSLTKIIRRWMDDPPDIPAPPEIRRDFLTLPKAQSILHSNPSWSQQLKGDLQMHTVWSDGSDSIEDMAKAAAERGYEFIAITDHAKGLKIAGGINEEQFATQAEEISQVNDVMAATDQPVRVLRSIELNLSPTGNGDWMDWPPKRAVAFPLALMHTVYRNSASLTLGWLLP